MLNFAAFKKRHKCLYKLVFRNLLAVIAGRFKQLTTTKKTKQRLKSEQKDAEAKRKTRINT